MQTRKSGLLLLKVVYTSGKKEHFIICKIQFVINILGFPELNHKFGLSNTICKDPSQGEVDSDYFLHQEAKKLSTLHRQKLGPHLSFRCKFGRRQTKDACMGRTSIFTYMNPGLVVESGALVVETGFVPT